MSRGASRRVSGATPLRSATLFHSPVLGAIAAASNKEKKKKRKAVFCFPFSFATTSAAIPSAERTGFVPRRKPKGKRSNTVAERYVISFSCSRSHSADAAHGATKKERRFTFPYFGATYGKSALWRREQDLNLRRLLTSHAFQACALKPLDHLSKTVCPSKKARAILLAKIAYQNFANKSIVIEAFLVFSCNANGLYGFCFRSGYCAPDNKKPNGARPCRNLPTMPP